MMIEVFKFTNDDWCGSYQMNGWHMGNKDQMMVDVTFNGMIGDGIWRTCVWGNDDCGMEYDCDNEAECWAKFLEVLAMDFVDMKELTNIGFVSA